MRLTRPLAAVGALIVVAALLTVAAVGLAISVGIRILERTIAPWKERAAL